MAGAAGIFDTRPRTGYPMPRGPKRVPLPALSAFGDAEHEKRAPMEKTNIAPHRPR